MGITEMKWTPTKKGGHIHVRCFARTLPTETWALCGTLVFSQAEWLSIEHTAPAKVEPLWIAISDEMPPDEQFVLLRGDSGCITAPEFIILGRTYFECRPTLPDGRIRWLDCTNEALSDNCWVPTHWRTFDEPLTQSADK